MNFFQSLLTSLPYLITLEAIKKQLALLFNTLITQKLPKLKKKKKNIHELLKKSLLSSHSYFMTFEAFKKQLNVVFNALITLDQ